MRRLACPQGLGAVISSFVANDGKVRQSTSRLFRVQGPDWPEQGGGQSEASARETSAQKDPEDHDDQPEHGQQQRAHVQRDDPADPVAQFVVA